MPTTTTKAGVTTFCENLEQNVAKTTTKCRHKYFMLKVKNFCNLTAVTVAAAKKLAKSHTNILTHTLMHTHTDSRCGWFWPFLYAWPKSKHKLAFKLAQGAKA